LTPPLSEPETLATNSEADPTSLDRVLVRHSKRPEWGLAILAKEKKTRRAYQFEDGQIREFKEGYYGLLEPVEEVEGAEELIIQRLEEAIGADEGKPAPQAQKAVAPFEAQVKLFESLYPEGFKDATWIEEYRRGRGRALKRHREPVIEKVREVLDREPVEAMIEGGRHGDLAKATLDILASTNLIPVTRVRELQGLDEDGVRAYAESVHFLLNGTDAFTVRFRRHLGALRGLLGTRPSWGLATVLPALKWPDEQVCVRHTAFLKQAGSIAPTGRYSSRARLRSYKNFRRVARTVRERLVELGHEPRDLLDVHDFIWATLRKSAVEKLQA
jgi:hypothetical protein